MAQVVDLGCLGTALVEVLGGEVDLEVDGFEVTLEPEFTWVLVKVKGLGGAGALREPMDSIDCLRIWNFRPKGDGRSGPLGPLLPVKNLTFWYT